MMIPVAFSGKPTSWSCENFYLSYWYKAINNIVPITLSNKPKFILVNSTSDSLRDFYLNWQGKTISIFLGLEAISPNFNDFDFALGFDPISYGDRYLRFNIAYQYQAYFPGIRDLETLMKISSNNSHLTRDRFCDFIYSNWDAHSNRDKFFTELSSKLFVNSYGNHLNNSIIPKTMTNLDWKSQSIEIKKMHKFSLCLENAFHIGYTSEKIFSSILSGSLPIYWGNPEIELDFNHKRFINLHSFPSNENAIDHILAIQRNIQEYESIIKSPIFTEKQIHEFEVWPNKFKDFIKIIFQDNSQNYRHSMGTFATRNRDKHIIYYYLLPIIEFINLWMRILKTGQYKSIINRKLSKKISKIYKLKSAK